MPQTERLRVRVDRGRCQGHARCNALAPELFRLDELGHSHEIGDGVVPSALNDKAWLAKANCPELAIDVIEE
jgi:ferredoxin